ncbi:hypothetical protein HK405_015981, partial [Cladochytrium tenue]
WRETVTAAGGSGATAPPSLAYAFQQQPQRALRPALSHPPPHQIRLDPPPPPPTPLRSGRLLKLSVATSSGTAFWKPRFIALTHDAVLAYRLLRDPTVAGPTPVATLPLDKDSVVSVSAGVTSTQPDSAAPASASASSHAVFSFDIGSRVPSSDPNNPAAVEYRVWSLRCSSEEDLAAWIAACHLCIDRLRVATATSAASTSPSVPGVTHHPAFEPTALPTSLPPAVLPPPPPGRGGATALVPEVHIQPSDEHDAVRVGAPIDVTRPSVLSYSWLPPPAVGADADTAAATSGQDAKRPRHAAAGAATTLPAGFFDKATTPTSARPATKTDAPAPKSAVAAAKATAAAAPAAAPPVAGRLTPSGSDAPPRGPTSTDSNNSGADTLPAGFFDANVAASPAAVAAAAAKKSKRGSAAASSAATAAGPAPSAEVAAALAAAEAARLEGELRRFEEGIEDAVGEADAAAADEAERDGEERARDEEGELGALLGRVAALKGRIESVRAAKASAVATDSA